MISINRGESFTIAIRLSGDIQSDDLSIQCIHSSGNPWFQPSPFDEEGVAFIRLSGNQTLTLEDKFYIYFVSDFENRGRRVSRRIPVSTVLAHGQGTNVVNQGIDYVVEILDSELVGVETWIAGYVKGDKGQKGDKGDQGMPGQKGPKGSSITGIRIAENNLVFDFDGGLPPQSVVVPAIQAANNAAASAGQSAADANASKLSAAQSSLEASGYAQSAQSSAIASENSKNISVTSAQQSIAAKDISVQKSLETLSLRNETEGYRDEVVILKDSATSSAASATSSASAAEEAKDIAVEAKNDTLAAKSAVDQQAAIVATNTQVATQKAQEASTSAQEALTSRNQAQGIKEDVEAIAQGVDDDRLAIEQAKTSVDQSVIAVDADAQQVANDKAIIEQLTLENQALRAENQILTNLSRDYNTQSANNAIGAIQTNIGGTNGIDNILPVAQLMPGMGLNGVNFLVARTGTGATAATNFNLRGMLERALPNRPRFDFDPVTRRPLGVLVESEGIEYSRGFGNLSTSFFLNFVSGSGVAPVRTLKSVANRFGVPNMCDRVFVDRGASDLTTDNSQIFQDFINLPVDNYTITFWARTNNTINEAVRVRIPGVGDVNVTFTPNWQFYSFSGNNSSVGNRSLNFGVRGTFTQRTADFSIDEIRVIPTAQSSFRPILNFQTTQNSLTRPPDNLTQTVTSWNQAEGTVVVHVRPNTKPHQSVFVASDGAPVQLVANGDDLVNFSRTQGGTGLLPVITPRSGTDRFGNPNTVDRVFFDRGASDTLTDLSRMVVISQAVPQTGTYRISFWGRSVTGTNQSIRVRRGEGGGADSTLVFTSTWQLFSVDAVFSSLGNIEFSLMTRGTVTPQTCDIFLSEISIRRVSDELRLQADGTLTFTRSGVTQTLNLGGSLNTFSSYAIAYSANRVAGCRNGGTVQEVTTAGNINVTNISYAPDVVGASKHVFAQYFARAMSNLSMQGKTGDFKYGQEPGDFALNQNLGELAFHNFQNLLAMGVADQTLRIRGTGSNVVETVSRDYPFEVITLFTSATFTTRTITGMDATLGYFPAGSVATLTFNAASGVVWDVAIRPRLTPS